MCVHACMCVCVEPLAKWIFALLPKSFQAAGLMHCILQLLVKFCCDEVHEALGEGVGEVVSGSHSDLDNEALSKLRPNSKPN